MMDLIRKYFPHLTSAQLLQFSSLQNLYSEWNEKINVVSRRDIANLYERHVLHSLSIAKFISFSPGTSILDAGTGGGFPGIPLAIFSPLVKFHLVDSVGKKIKVVEEISKSLRLANVSFEKARAEDISGKFDFIVSRAVAPVQTIFSWTKNSILKENRNAIPNGWILLKGGNLKHELNEFNKGIVQVSIAEYFGEEFFKEKFIIFFPEKN